MTDVRAIYRPGRESPGHGNGAPSGPGRQSLEARAQLAAYLDAALMRPLHFRDSDRTAQIETALDTMTPAERVWLEIEMQERKGSFYSSDYDPLPVR